MARMNIEIPNLSLVVAPKCVIEHVSGKSDFYAKGAALLPGSGDTAGSGLWLGASARWTGCEHFLSVQGGF